MIPDRDGYDTLMRILAAAWRWQNRLNDALFRRGHGFASPAGDITGIAANAGDAEFLADDWRLFEYAVKLTAEADAMRDALEERNVVQCAECGAWHDWHKSDEHDRCPACSQRVAADEQARRALSQQDCLRRGIA